MKRLSPVHLLQSMDTIGFFVIFLEHEINHRYLGTLKEFLASSGEALYARPVIEGTTAIAVMGPRNIVLYCTAQSKARYNKILRTFCHEDGLQYIA